MFIHVSRVCGSCLSACALPRLCVAGRGHCCCCCVPVPPFGLVGLSTPSVCLISDLYCPRSRSVARLLVCWLLGREFPRGVAGNSGLSCSSYGLFGAMLRMGVVLSRALSRLCSDSLELGSCRCTAASLSLVAIFGAVAGRPCSAWRLPLIAAVLRVRTKFARAHAWGDGSASWWCAVRQRSTAAFRSSIGVSPHGRSGEFVPRCCMLGAVLARLNVSWNVGGAFVVRRLGSAVSGLRGSFWTSWCETILLCS